MTKVKEILKGRGVARKTVGIPNRRLNQPLQTRLYPGDIGIEIELEGENLPNAGYLDAVRSKSGVSWQVKQDNSLRGGLEYVLSAPCPIEEVAELCNGLFGVFAARRTNLIPSNRCSIHIHYNVGGLKVNSITSIIALWTIFEEPLLRTWGDARYKNHFCLSTKDEEATLASWEAFLKTGRLPEERNLRYSALNLVAVRSYGSLEFRGGGAVNSAQDATRWATFLHRLCKYAEERYPNPQQIAYDLSERGPLAILRDICDGGLEAFANEVYGTVDHFSQACMDSFHNVQPILFDFPWGEWQTEINKAYVPDPFKSKAAKPRTNRIEPVDPVPGVQWRDIAGRQVDRVVVDQDLVNQAIRFHRDAVAAQRNRLRGEEI